MSRGEPNDDESSTASLSLSDLASVSTPVQTGHVRGHKRIRKYNASGNFNNSDSPTMSTTSFGSIRSPIRRMHSADGSTMSPRRVLLTPNTPRRRQKALQPMKEALAARPLHDSINLTQSDRLAHEKLADIHQHKSGIAEMRRTRQVRFRPLAKASSTTPTRINGIDLNDLSLHMVKQSHESANRTEEQRLIDEIRRLENGIRQCFKDLDRVKRETDKDAKLAAATEEENIKLRAEILSLPGPHKQSIKQAQHQLEATMKSIRKEMQTMDDQLILLQGQQQLLEIETEDLLGLTDHMTLLDSPVDNKCSSPRNRKETTPGSNSPKEFREKASPNRKEQTKSSPAAA